MLCTLLQMIGWLGVLSGFVCTQYYIAPKLYRKVQEIFFVVGEWNDLECSLRVDFLIVGKAFGTYSLSKLIGYLTIIVYAHVMKHKHIHANNKLQHCMICVFKNVWLVSGTGQVKVALRCMDIVSCTNNKTYTCIYTHTHTMAC